MIGIVTMMMLVVGCGETEKQVETPPLPGPGVKPPEAAQEAATSCSKPGNSSFPIGDGPTEFRVGNAIVGVGWREGGTEWVYMFNAPVSYRQGWEKGATIASYKNTLVPQNPGGSGTAEAHEVRPYRRYTGSGVFAWCYNAQCYLDRPAFENASTGFPANVKARVNPNAQLTFTTAQGQWGRVDAFDPTACPSPPPVGGSSHHHVDVLKNHKSDEVGWQYSWVEGTQTKVYTVLRAGTAHAGGLTHADAGLPTDNSSPLNGSLDEWCVAVDPNCPASNPCTARLVTWDYLPPD